MSVVTVPATCCCGSIGRTDLRQCPEHWHIWQGDVRLTSVTRVVNQFFPLPAIDPAILANARDRGKQVDGLFADYVRGELRAIPAGTRRDAVDLLHKLIGWYDRQNFKTVEIQVLLGNGKYGGVVDFIFDDIVVDLKATSKILASHEIQVAGYFDLLYSMSKNAFNQAWYGRKPNGMGILHATKSIKEAQLVPLKPAELCIQWATLCDAYKLLEQRGVFNANAEEEAEEAGRN